MTEPVRVDEDRVRTMRADLLATLQRPKVAFTAEVDGVEVEVTPDFEVRVSGPPFDGGAAPSAATVSAAVTVAVRGMLQRHVDGIKLAAGIDGVKDTAPARKERHKR